MNTLKKIHTLTKLGKYLLTESRRRGGGMFDTAAGEGVGGCLIQLLENRIIYKASKQT